MFKDKNFCSGPEFESGSLFLHAGVLTATLLREGRKGGKDGEG